MKLRCAICEGYLQKSVLKGRDIIFTARKRSLGQGNIFRSVCQEFRPQGRGIAGGCAWPGGSCMARGGVHGGGHACLGKMHGCGGHACPGEHAWPGGSCMAGVICVRRGACMSGGACVAMGGVHGGGHACHTHPPPSLILRDTVSQ